jgi:hypothetical protein
MVAIAYVGQWVALGTWTIMATGMVVLTVSQAARGLWWCLRRLTDLTRQH